MLEQVTTSLAKYPSLDSRPNYKSDVSHSFAQIFLESRKQQPNYLKLCMLKSAKANEYSHTLCMFFQTIADCKPSMMLNRISTKPNPNSFTPLDPLSNCGNFVACEYSHSF
jgi:hypothetical protein